MPLGHAQVVPEQTPSCGQYVQVPPQLVMPLGHPPQVVPEQMPPEGHVTQVPPQLIVPVGHTQLVPEQTPPCGQVRQIPPQQLCPDPQAFPHPPQLSSVCKSVQIPNLPHGTSPMGHDVLGGVVQTTLPSG